VQIAVLDQHVVGNAPHDAVAVRLTHSQSAQRDPIALIQANAAVVECALVNHLIPGLVAIDREILDDDVRNTCALQQREIGGDLGLALQVVPLLQAAVQFEAITRGGDERSLDDVGALAVGVFGHETDAVADLEAFGIGQRDLLIPMIAVHDEFRDHRRLLHQHRVCPAAYEPDAGLEKDRVAQSIGARQNADGAASPSCHVVHRRLQHSVCVPDEIGLPGADRDRYTLVPFRLN